jgi:prepilin-type N-terminal cleavage/methylation domain-containing protein
MLTTPRLQKGLTLIEMMIAMVLGIFVSSVIITVFSTNVRSNVQNMKMIRLNQELRGAMTFMVDELKKAGYSADPTNPAFMASLDVSTSCILYSYDLNNNGSRDADERFGFGLDTGSNQIRWSDNAAKADCPTFGGSITDANMAEITTLDFSFDGSANNNGAEGITALTTSFGVSVYDLTITLTGTIDLPHDSTSNDPRRTITETIRLRNDDPKN